MAEISKPDYTYLWSSGGAIVAPSNVKIQTGWTAEVPPFQWENWSQNRQDQAIAHVLQHGVSVWDAVTEYQAGKSYVTGSDGKIYVALTTNTNQNPTTDTLETNWANIFKKNQVVLSTVGVSSWTVPLILKLGIKFAKVTVVGGGGGGGGATSSPNFNAAGGGGGAGGAAIEVLDLTGVTSVSVTIAAGGSPATNGVGTGATSGGTSTFGAFCSATGGVFGNSAGGGSAISGTAAGNDGGIGSGGTLNIRGGAGQSAVAATPTIAGSTVAGGAGGDSILAGGSRSLIAIFGAGGGGAATSVGSTSVAGLAGAPGAVIIEW